MHPRNHFVEFFGFSHGRCYYPSQIRAISEW